MIRINLLPDEYRRNERTSPKLFAAVIGAVVLVCCSLGWFGYVYFGELGKLQLEHKEVQERLANLQKQVAYFTALSKEEADFRKREKTIQDIAQSRVLWTRVMDQLVDMVNNDGETERHMAWFRGVTVKPGNAKAGPEVTMPGFVQGDEFKRLAAFHEDFEAAPFYRYVTTKSEPIGAVREDPGKTPPSSITFNLKFQFETPAKWKRDEGKTAAPAPK